MRKLFVGLTLLCAMWISGTATAQAQRTPTVPAAAAATSAAPIISQKDAELIALQAQYEILKQYHSSLLETVHWALGVVGVVAALIVGASGLINFKVYEADKDRLREQFTSKVNELTAQADSKINTARAAIQAEVQSLLQSQTDRLNGEFLGMRSEILNHQTEIQGQLRSQADRLSGELLAIRAEIGTHQGEVQAQFRSQADAVRTDISGIRTELSESGKSQKEDLKKLDGVVEKYSSRIEDLSKRINAVETFARYAEEMTWRIQKIPMNTLRAQYQGLNAAIESDGPWRVDMLLQRILETLEILKKTGEKCDGWTLDQARQAVEKASSNSPELAPKVLKALAELPQTESE